MILTGADANCEQTGSWPTVESGEIREALGETWSSVPQSLNHGRRGLPEGSSLTKRRRLKPVAEPLVHQSLQLRAGKRGLTLETVNKLAKHLGLHLVRDES